MRALHVSPHPDDELIGAPATLLALRDAGHEIVNFACSLGRPEDADRRRAELEEACRRAGFALEVASEPLTSAEARGSPEVRSSTEERLGRELEALLENGAFELVLAPSPHDRHPGHELVGRAVRRLIERRGSPGRWWMWALWGYLPFPTTVVNFDESRLEEIGFDLDAHTGEMERNDYRELVAGRALSARVLAAELVFGFGSPALPGPFVEATCEVVRSDRQWRLGARRELVPDDPFPPPAGPDIAWWLAEASAGDRLVASELRPRGT